MANTDPILSRIREEAYAQAQGNGWISLPASPSELARLCLGERWLQPAHLELLNRELVDAAAGKLRKAGYVGLLVALPPRHGKSTLVNQWFPAWYIGRHPGETIISVSYEADYAASWGRKARDIIIENGRRLFGVTVRDDNSAASCWEIADHGGGMMTSGVGGPLTGKGGRVLILDDFCKNGEEAASSILREKWWNWYVSTFRTRLEPGGFILIIATRWHEDDLIGRINRRMESDSGADRFKMVRLPAVAEEDDLLGRKPGDPLWPERFDLSELNRIQCTLGHSAWSSLYQQSPTTIESTMFRREQFRFVDTALPCVKSVRFWDLASTRPTNDNEPDWTVGAKLGIDKIGRVTILDLRRMRGAARQVDELVRRTALEDGASVLVRIEEEPGSASRIVVDRLRTDLQGFDVQGVPSYGNKVSRAKPLSEFAAAGRLALVRASWNATLLDEFEAFPAGRHDDQVDACAGAFAEIGVSADTRSPELADIENLRVEPLEYKMALKLYRSWSLAGVIRCCVWFQIHPLPDGSEQVRILLEAHSDRETAADFMDRVLSMTDAQYRCARPVDVVIAPKIPMDADTRDCIDILGSRKIRVIPVQWSSSYDTIFAQKAKAGRICINQDCPMILAALRASGCRSLGDGVAGDSYWEPLTQAIKGGVARLFGSSRPPRPPLRSP